jgi:NADH dehydrogenase [ubiquinone] 1 alpha subcomplex assembly factor 7
VPHPNTAATAAVGGPANLAEHLTRRIRALGPLTVEAYMTEVLTHPRYGYYVAQQPFGQSGDFITAPEVSQMFGELIGAWMADTWTRMGRPSGIHMAEIGPGRGVLMRDLLRAAATVPGLRQTAHVHLIDVSATLRAVQRRALAESGWDIQWHSSFADLPDGPLLLVANELFDALPIRQFVRTRAGWCERLVEIGPDETFRFVLTRGPAPASALIPEAVRDTAPLESVAEVCPAAIGLATAIAGRVASDGGAALIIDYGNTEFGARDTLQAVAHHRSHPVLERPGSADICAHVDFAMVAQAAREAGARVWGPRTQGEFLRTIGISERAMVLSRVATPEQRDEITAAMDRLIGPHAMGGLFKVISIAAPALADVAGFQ